MTCRIALVVPNLEHGGGVTTVARFVRDTIVRTEGFELMQVSLATAAGDPCHMRIARPGSWRRGAITAPGTWDGRAYTHVGAVAGELEFQRYRTRAALTRVLADCDIVQVVCGSPAWANAVLGVGKPVALQVATRALVERRTRDARPRSAKAWWRKGMTRIMDRLDDRVLRRVDAIQLENPWMHAYAQGLNRGRDVDIRYAPPGIDADRLRPLPGVDRMKMPYILCVGRLGDPRKNITLVLEAYKRLPVAVRKRTQLVLAGRAPPPGEFWERAEAAGLRRRIRYVARPGADELRDLYQHASVFALPSNEEGLGMVLLEAMACGAPAVATRCGGPDGVIGDGEDGFLVPVGDAQAMADRLQCLLADPERNRAMGSAARRTIEARYDQHVAGAVFEAMWQRLLTRRGDFE